MKLEEAKKILNENGYQLNESSGWKIEEADIAGLNEVMNDCRQLFYELENCVRGTHTGCEDWAELGNWIKENIILPFTEVSDTMIKYSDDLPSGEDEE